VIGYVGTTWSYLGAVPIDVEEYDGGITLHFDPHHGELCHYTRCRLPVHRVELTGTVNYAPGRPGWGTRRIDIPVLQIIVNSVIRVQHDPCGCVDSPYINRRPW
jgi:hypothetical protein